MARRIRFGGRPTFIGAILGPSWEYLWRSWSHLGPSWGHLGPSWGHGHLGAILGLSWAILGSTWPSWGAILGDLEDVPSVLGGHGRFVGDVSQGLGGPVGPKNQGPNPPRGSGGGFGVTRGEEKGGINQLTEGWRSMWICGSVYESIYRTVGERLKLNASQPDGPSQGGAGGYIYTWTHMYTDIRVDVYMYTHIYMHLYMYTYIHIYLQIHIYIYMLHIYTQSCTHIRTVWTRVGHFGALFGYFLDTVWTLFGDASDMFRTPFGHFSDTGWALVGHFSDELQTLSDMFRTCSGHFWEFSDTYRTCLGRFSDTSGTLFGHFADMSFHVFH
jgi:hypothetical protein